MLKITVCYTMNFVPLWVAKGQINTFTFFFSTRMEIPFPLRAHLVHFFTFIFSPVQWEVRMLNTFKCFGGLSEK